mmetsp:Transcript_30322/g.80417  ORF Transcript_30322/g.80417 Transcript_30322/m.80417 type:complete len:209 (-) Transcript_30322:545-1171(-)
MQVGMRVRVELVVVAHDCDGHHAAPVIDIDVHGREGACGTATQGLDALLELLPRIGNRGLRDGLVLEPCHRIRSALRKALLQEGLRRLQEQSPTQVRAVDHLDELGLHRPPGTIVLHASPGRCWRDEERCDVLVGIPPLVAGQAMGLVTGHRATASTVEVPMHERDLFGVLLLKIMLDRVLHELQHDGALLHGGHRLDEVERSPVEAH